MVARQVHNRQPGFQRDEQAERDAVGGKALCKFHCHTYVARHQLEDGVGPPRKDSPAHTRPGLCPRGQRANGFAPRHLPCGEVMPEPAVVSMANPVVDFKLLTIN